MRFSERALVRKTSLIVRLASVLRDDASVLVERAANDSDGGLPQGGDGRSSKYADDGSRNGSTPNLAMRPVDPVDAASQALWDHLSVALRALHEAAKAAAYLRPIPLVRAQDLVKKAPAEASAECANPACGVVVANTREDRIRAGRCPACFEYRRRTGGERSRGLCHPEDGTQENAA